LRIYAEAGFEDNTSSEKNTVAVEKKNAAITKKKSSTQHRNGWITYTVESGDVLVNIAQKYGVEVQDIQQWNGLRSSKITAGEKLDLYIDTEAQTEKNISATEKKTEQLTTQNSPLHSDKKIIIHKVKRGDNLYEIAKKYGVSLSSLKEWNNLNSSKLKIGMSLKVYL